MAQQAYYVVSESGYFYGLPDRQAQHPDPKIKKGQTLRGKNYRDPDILWYYSDEPIDRTQFFYTKEKRVYGNYQIDPNHKSVKFLTNPPIGFVNEEDLEEYLLSQGFRYDEDESEWLPSNPYLLQSEILTTVEALELEWFELELPDPQVLTEPVEKYWEYEANPPYNWLIPPQLHYLYPGRLVVSNELLDWMQKIISEAFPKYGIERRDGKISIRNLQTILGSWSAVGEVNLKTFDFSGDNLLDAFSKVETRFKTWIKQTLDEIENPTVKCPHCEGLGRRRRKKPSPDSAGYFMNIHVTLNGFRNRKNENQIQKCLADLKRIEELLLTKV